MVNSANMATTTPADQPTSDEDELWAAPALPPTPSPASKPVMSISEALANALNKGLAELRTKATTSPQNNANAVTDKLTPGGHLWAEPAIPPTPSPAFQTAPAKSDLTVAKPTTTTSIPQRKPKRTQRQLFPPQHWRGRPERRQPSPPTPLQHAGKRPPQPVRGKAATPTPTTPQYRRLQQLRQLRLLRRNRHKRQNRPAPPSTPTQHSAPSPPTTHPTQTTHPTFDMSLSPISMHSPITPYTPIIDTLHLTNPTNLTNTLLNDFLNDTQPQLNDTPTIIYSQSNFMNETQSPKHIYYMNGSYTHISHD